MSEILVVPVCGAVGAGDEGEGAIAGDPLGGLAALRKEAEQGA